MALQRWQRFGYRKRVLGCKGKKKYLGAEASPVPRIPQMVATKIIRFSPACAGNGPFSLAKPHMRAVQPRVCGERS